MKYRLVAVAALLAVLVAFPPPSSGQGDKAAKGGKLTDQKASAWMKSKLQLSQRILEGLTEGDFDKIGKSAKSLHLLDYLEAAFRADRPDYKRQIALFDTSVQQLIRQAKAKNTEGATLAYTQLTVSCVQCHQIVRDAQKTAGGTKP